MRNRIYKKIISSVTVASVVLSTLANTAAAYALEMPGRIVFTGGIYTRYTGNLIADVQGTKGAVISETAPYNDRQKYPISAVTESEEHQRLRMPFFDDDYVFHAGTWGDTRLDSTTFPGYKITGWYESEEDKAMGSASKLIPTRFPVNQITYTPVFASDGTEYKYKIKYDVVSANAMIRDVLPAEENGQKPTMDSVLLFPKNIPGYKLNGVPEVKFFEPGSDFTQENHPRDEAKNYDFDVTEAKVSGKMVNKDLQVTYKYDVDPEKKFKFTIVNHVLDRNGNEKNPKDIRYDLSHKFSAEEAITDIKPNETFITPSSQYESEARYILVTDGDKRPFFASEKRGANDSYLPLTTEAGDHIVGNESNHLRFDGNFNVTGRMINQVAEVHYYYKPNPNYRNTIIMRYENERGVDIRDEVIKALAAKGITVGEHYDDDNPDAPYKVEGGIAIKGKPSTAYDIYAPSLAPLYKEDNGSVSAYISEGAAEFAGDRGVINGTGWTKERGTFDIRLGDLGTSLEVTVSYEHNATAIKALTVDTDGNGKLMVGNEEFDVASHPEQDIVLEKMPNGHVTVNENDLPKLQANPGYMPDGWYYKDSAGNDTKVENWPFETTSDSVIFIAKFVKDESKWLKYTIDIASDSTSQNQLSFADDNRVVEMLAVDENTGEPKDASLLTFAALKDMEEFPMIDLRDNNTYSIKFFDHENNELQNDTTIGHLGGTTIYAKAVATGNVNINDPEGEVYIDENTGLPAIKITNLNPITSIKYLVVEKKHEDRLTWSTQPVRAIISGVDMANNRGIISGDFLKVGKKYGIFEAKPNVQVRKDEILAAEYPRVSNIPLEKMIPPCVKPQVTEDPENPGRAAITISPTTPNTKYALIDENGNVVEPFTDPVDGKVVFGDLENDRVYRVVAKESTSPANPGDLADNSVEVSTANLGVSASKYDLALVLPDDTFASSVIIGGEQKDTHNPDDLKGIAPRKSVRISVPAQDATGAFFQRWHMVSGRVLIQNLNAATIAFVMPSEYVKLQAIYGDGSVEFDDNLKELFDNKDVESNYPTGLSAGKYRMHIQKLECTDAVENRIKESMSMPDFHGMWISRVVLQKWDNNDQAWKDVTDEMEHDVTFKTGKLLSTNKYHLFKIGEEIPTATPSNATPESDGVDYNRTVSNADYPGSLDMKHKNNNYYVFGYTVPNLFKIKLKDALTNEVFHTYTVREDGRLSDYESDYQEYPTQPKPDYEQNPDGSFVGGDGITYRYEGLSSSATEFEQYRDFEGPTQDETVYFFYSNDRTQRAAAKNALEDKINDVERIIRTVPAIAKPEYQDVVNTAKNVLKKLQPRKATTIELEDALAELEDAVNKLNEKYSGYVPNEPSRPSTGGSGSSGGSTDNNHYNANNFIHRYQVGGDGNWKLIDPVNHLWIFETSQGRVKGFANLYYTYQDVTKEETYHFNEDGVMDFGWLFKDGSWYYLSEVHDGFFGKMVRGWHLDPHDNKWYYLSPQTGKMGVGWHKINDVWYYFTPFNQGPTWVYNSVTQKWLYGNNVMIKPYGSLYMNEFTPDGFYINNDGAWDGVLR